VDDAFFVGILQGVADLRDDGQRFFRLQPAGAQGLAQVHAIDVFHHKIVKAIDLAEIVNADDMGMIQPGQGPRFPREALGKSRVPAPLGRQDLERHHAVKSGLSGLVNRSHAPLAKEFEDLQLRKMAGQFRGGHDLE